MHIYVLLNEKNEVRYVGKAKNPVARLSGHLGDKSPRKNGRWIRSMLKKGLRPTLQIVEDYPADWREAEIWWVAWYKHLGADLTNLTAGGDGLTGASVSTRQKLREVRNKEWADPKRREVLLAGLRSPARRSKISRALTGKKKTRCHVEKLPQNNKGHRLREETRQKISQSLIGNSYALGLKHTDETKARIAAKLQGNQHTKGRVMPEKEKEIRAIAITGMRRSPETKERMRVARLAYWANKRSVEKFSA